MYLFFSFFLRYFFLEHEVLWLFIDIHCTFSLLYRWYMFFFHLPFHVLFLFFLYTHAFYYLYAIYYFYFTQRYLDEFCLKCFRNIGCQKSTCHKLSFCKVFLRVCVMIDFIVFNKWIWVGWFMTSLICSFVCCGFVTDCQKGRLLGHMCFTCKEYMLWFCVIDLSFDKMHFTCIWVDLECV